MKIKIVSLLVIAFLLLAFVTPAYADGPVCDPADPACVAAESSPPTPTNPSLPDVAVLIAIVAFFKKRLDLKENGVSLAVVLVGAVLWFGPQVIALFPGAADLANQVLAFAKWVLASMGAVDFSINTGAKILTATKKDVE